jgi:EmrB/QacA subfamily drug resistance transporter
MPARISSPRHAAAVLAVTGAALFMIVLDNLIVVSTLPAIQRSLHAPLSSLEWIVDAYILSFAALILSGAALGERFGRRRVFVIALVLFSLASAAGALAPNVGTLTAARAVQGVGGAMLMPLTLTLLSAAYPPERRGQALGIWSAIAGLGVALGPLAGGLLATALSWHWIFWVNVPIGLAAAVATPRVLAESRGARAPIDLPGIAFVSAGLLAVVWATVRGNAAGWGASSTLAAYGAGVALLGAFVAWEARSRAPMLPLGLFRVRTFSAANTSGFAFQFTMFAAFLMIVQFLASIRHEGPVMIGVWTLPWTIMPLLVSPLGGRLGARIEPGVLVIGGMTLIALAVLVLAALLGPGTTPAEMAPELAGIGIGIGFVLPNVTAVTMRSVAPADIGRASGTLSTARQLGAVFGVAVAVAVFGLAGSPVDGFRDALAGAGLMALAGAAIAGLTRPRRDVAMAEAELAPSP